MLRIVSAVALFAVVAAGCGGAARPQNDCRAMRLAASLRAEVTAFRHKLPLGLRSPLLTGVNALADRISTCTRVVTMQTPTKPKPPGPPKGPKPKPPHGPPGHGKGNHK